jgi:hypothetical protein
MFGSKNMVKIEELRITNKDNEKIVISWLV